MAAAINPEATQAGALPGGRAGYPRPHPPPFPPSWSRKADPARSCSVPGTTELAKGDAEGSGGRNWGPGTPFQAAQEMPALPSRGVGGGGKPPERRLVTGLAGRGSC